MKTPKSIIIICSSLMLLGLVAVFFARYFYYDTLPQNQIVTGKTYFGLLLALVVFWVLRWANKSLLKIDKEISIAQLTAYGCLIVFLAELPYQVYRVYLGDLYLNDFIKSILASTLMFTVLAFLIAFYFKTKRTNVLIGMIVVLMVLVNLYKAI